MASPAEDLEYHARITDMVSAHLALNGGLRLTAFVEAFDDEGPRIVIIDSQELGEEQHLFIDLVRRTSVDLSSARTAIASEVMVIKHDDPEVLADIHESIVSDPSVLDTHPLMRKGVSIQVESDAGLTSAFHSLTRHHPEMAELLPTHTSFQPVSVEAAQGVVGFHVPTHLRDSPEVIAIVDRTRHLAIGTSNREVIKQDA